MFKDRSLIGFLPYFAKNYLRLLGVGKSTSGWIDPNNQEKSWKKIEDECVKKNEFHINRSDFGFYFKWKEQRKEVNHGTTKSI